LEKALETRGLADDPMFDGMDPQTQGKVNTALQGDPLKKSREAQKEAQAWAQQRAQGNPREFANCYEYARARYNEIRKAAEERLSGQPNARQGAHAEAATKMTHDALENMIEEDLAKVSPNPPGRLDPLPTTASPDEVARQVQGLERVAFESPTAEVYHARKHQAEVPDELKQLQDPVLDYASAAHDTIHTGTVVEAVRVQGDSIQVVIRKDYGDPKVTMEAIIYVTPDGTVTLATYGKQKKGK
jgi:hypothetical protein